MPPNNPSADEVFARLRAHLPELRAKFGLRQLWLFGSRLRADVRPESDLDVLAEFDRVPSFFEFIALEDRLSEITGLPVDLVMKRALKPNIGRRIVAEAVAL